MKSKKSTKPRKIEWTIYLASVEFGVSRETVLRGLRQNDVPVKELYSTPEIFAALAGDLDKEKTRVERAKADKLERENKAESENWMTREQVERALTQWVILPWRQRLLEAHLVLADKCTSPDAAREAIKAWVDDSMKIVEQQVNQNKELK